MKYILGPISIFIVEAAIKSTLTLGLSYLFSMLLVRRAASLGLAILSCGIAATIIFVLLLPVAPQWNFHASSVFHFQGSPTISYPDEPGDPAISSSGPGLSELVSAGFGYLENSDFVPAVGRGIGVLWLVVFLFLFGRLLFKLWGLRRLKQNSEQDNEIEDFLKALSQELGRRPRNIKLVISNSVGTAVTWGFLRHVILLPGDFRTLPIESRRSILIHELNHVWRCDFFFRIFSEALCAILWFQPFAWLVYRRIREEQEKASDDQVLCAGEKPSQYAKTLLICQQRLLVETGLPIALGAIAHSSLRRRIDSILDPERRREPMPLPALMLAVVIAAVGGLPMAMLQILDTGSRQDNRELTAVSTSMEAQPEGFELKLDTRQKEFEKINSATETSEGLVTPRRGTAQNSSRVISRQKFENTVTAPSAESAAIRNLPKPIVAQRDAGPTVEDKRQDAPSGNTKRERTSPSQMVKNVFDNVRAGFANGKRPVRVFEPE